MTSKEVLLILKKHELTKIRIYSHNGNISLFYNNRKQFTLMPGIKKLEIHENFPVKDVYLLEALIYLTKYPNILENANV